MAPRKTAAQLSLEQVIARYTQLDDAAFIKKVFDQVVSQSVNHRQKLSPQTVVEYSSSFNTLVRHIEAAAGARRASLPSLAEIVLRAHGPQTVRTLISAPSLMRKVCIVACAIVCRAFPELSDDDRQAASATWQAAASTSKRTAAAAGTNCDHWLQRKPVFRRVTNVARDSSSFDEAAAGVRCKACVSVIHVAI
jgi:hypothetical protein